MQPVSFEGAIEIKKPADMTDEQCMSVWANYGFSKLHQIIKLKEGGINVIPPVYAGVDTQDFPYFLTKWQPSYEDIQAINRGEGVFIKSLGKSLVPMAVFTVDENGNCNDAG